MINLTNEEKRVVLFVLGMAFCALILNSLIKLNKGFEKIIYPQVELAKVNLNKISIDELIGLKCIPEKLARRIIEYRLMRQEFTSLDELKDVKGIGPARYEKLKKIFFVE